MATNTIIFKSAPQTSNVLSTRSHLSTPRPIPEVSSDHERAPTVSVEIFTNNPLLPNQQNSMGNMESGEVQNSIFNAHSTRKNKTKKELKLLEHTEHRLGPTSTSQLLPRKTNVLCGPSNYIPSNHPTLGGTPRFSPRQVLDWGNLADRAFMRPIHFSLNPPQSSFTQDQGGS